MEYKKILTFSFDDGVTQDERFIEILDKYGLKCTFNLNSELLGKEGHLIIDGQRISHNKVSPERVRELYKNHEVAAHTLTHPNLTALEPDEAVRQVEVDREKLSTLVGYEVRGFAYPCGGVNSNKAVGELIKNRTSVEFARTIVHSYSFDLQENMYLFNPTVSLAKNKEKTLELCERFMKCEPDDIQLFYIWGHSYELDLDNGWEFFEKVCRLLSGRDDILYCTNSDAFDYIKSVC